MFRAKNRQSDNDRKKPRCFQRGSHFNVLFFPQRTNLTYMRLHEIAGLKHLIETGEYYDTVVIVQSHSTGAIAYGHNRIR